MTSSAIHVHELQGSSPIPLSSYLKGLGVLRIVSQQADEASRGWWKSEIFHLAATLDHSALERLLLDEYEPTPILAPWNGASGFYPKDKKTGIEALENSTAPRFEQFRETIGQGRRLCAGLSAAPKKEEKDALLRRCRSVWRGAAAEWLAASVVLKEDGSASYPALFGTGGNDGHLDFTNNFMQRLVDVFDTDDPRGAHRPGAVPLLRSALWGTPVPGLTSAAIGQFDPKGAGGANSTSGFAGESLVNPWDFILMLEGAVLFCASIVRRAESADRARAVAPFAVVATAAGYGSAARADENARGEQWMPLWERPATLAEVSSVLAEGRSEVGRRRAREAVDFARAISRLGVARGITEFQRFGYIERHGQNKLATPLGRWRVGTHAHQELIDQVAPWVSRLHRAAAASHAPATVARASRRCDEALMACSRESDITGRWQSLLVELGRAEGLAVRNGRFANERGLQPLPRLSAAWLAAIDDGSAEVRIAAALAATRVASTEGPGSDPVRVYWLPVVGSASFPRFESGPSGIQMGLRQVCRGVDLVHDLIALLRRRCVEALRGGDGTLGLDSRAAQLADADALAHFLSGSFDDAKCLSLAVPLMALHWADAERTVRAVARARRSEEGEDPGVVYGVFRLALPSGRPFEYAAAGLGAANPRMDVAAFELLASGQLTRGFECAIRRLRAAGLRPKARVAVGNASQARRLAASLAIPISQRTLGRIVETTAKPAAETSVVPEMNPQLVGEQ